MGGETEKNRQDPLKYYLAYRKQRATLSMIRLVLGLLAGFVATIFPVAYGGCFVAIPLAAVFYVASSLALKNYFTLLSQKEMWTTGLVQLVAGVFIGLALGSA